MSTDENTKLFNLLGELFVRDSRLRTFYH